MKKIILFVSIILATGTLQAQESKPAAPATIQENKNAPDLKFEVEEFDFGTIKQGEKVTYDFNFTNGGKEPLIISNATGTCGCTVPQWPKEPIAKGGKGTIHVEFNSAGKMGMQDKTVTIVSNGKVPSKILHLKGNVEAPPAVKTDGPQDKK